MEKNANSKGCEMSPVSGLQRPLNLFPRVQISRVSADHGGKGFSQTGHICCKWLNAILVGHRQLWVTRACHEVPALASVCFLDLSPNMILNQKLSFSLHTTRFGACISPRPQLLFTPLGGAGGGHTEVEGLQVQEADC